MVSEYQLNKQLEKVRQEKLRREAYLAKQKRIKQLQAAIKREKFEATRLGQTTKGFKKLVGYAVSKGKQAYASKKSRTGTKKVTKYLQAYAKRPTRTRTVRRTRSYNYNVFRPSGRI